MSCRRLSFSAVFESGVRDKALYMALFKEAVLAPLPLSSWEEAIPSPNPTGGLDDTHWVWRYWAMLLPGAGSLRSSFLLPGTGGKHEMGSLGAAAAKQLFLEDRQPPGSRGWESHLNHECQHCKLVRVLHLIARCHLLMHDVHLGSTCRWRT